MIDIDRRLAEKHTTVFPAAGIYSRCGDRKVHAHLAIGNTDLGKDKVASELPLRADLKGNVWTVIGNPHLLVVEWAGELIIQLDKKMGRVLSFLHTM